VAPRSHAPIERAIIHTRRCTADELARHGRVPIAFRVERVLDPAVLARMARQGAREHGRGARRRASGFPPDAEHPVPRRWIKDYDVDPAERPLRWLQRWDLSAWRLLVAVDPRRGRRLGGLVLARGTDGLDMLEGRHDLAVIWDLRVRPGARRRGVGSALVRAAIIRARNSGARELKVETQNVNVPACHLYLHHGFALRIVRPGAYPALPDEVMLLWYRALAPARSGTMTVNAREGRAGAASRRR